MKKSQAIAYIARFVGVGLTFLLSTFLARALGAEDFGTYSFLLALIMLLTLPTQSALPIIALRDAAKNNCKEGKNILSESTKKIIHISTIYGLGLAISTIVLSHFYTFPDVDDWLVYSLSPLFIIIPLSLLYSSIFRGCGNLLISMIPEYVIKPLATMVLVLSFYLTFSVIDLYLAAVSTVISSSAIVIFYGIFLKKNTKFEKSNSNDYNFKQVFNLSIISGGQVIFANIEVFFLGILSEVTQVGIFKVALVISLLIIFSQTVINQIIQPDIVRKYQNNDLIGLQNIIKRSSLIIVSLGAFIFFVIMIIGQDLIAFFYGNEYRSSYYILLILSCGQIINMAFGSVGTILNMTKNESYAVKPMLFTVVSNIALDLVLIHFYGAYGAAVAAVVSTLLWNVLLRNQVLKRTGIESSGLVLLFKG
ncbi:oligosaccharide flippase family protein [Vibrio coralliilyticus]|uniref:lipopolysaccharide biosynthesis protein n=1 Tax=Vibrio coralliilyticus TaxID=190893 RepID=UPI00155F6F3B|nr:oligosaccharide flippase family protein [Vibrio coralliilyticus]NRF27192.1 oligosaccharide flippase family protein [Vibrio coralliilyticus]NRF81462.1 oligosaccharide flippase family protein [Vibrio coralliilyticus]